MGGMNSTLHLNHSVAVGGLDGKGRVKYTWSVATFFYSFSHSQFWATGLRTPWRRDQ